MSPPISYPRTWVVPSQFGYVAPIDVKGERSLHRIDLDRSKVRTRSQCGRSKFMGRARAFVVGGEPGAGTVEDEQRIVAGMVDLQHALRGVAVVMRPRTPFGMLHVGEAGRVCRVPSNGALAALRGDGCANGQQRRRAIRSVLVGFMAALPVRCWAQRSALPSISNTYRKVFQSFHSEMDKP